MGARPLKPIVALLTAALALTAPAAMAFQGADQVADQVSDQVSDQAANQPDEELSAADAEAVSDRTYGLDYRAEFQPGQGTVKVSVTVRQERDLLRRVRFRIDAGRYDGFSADGNLKVEGDQVQWHPPREGGALRFNLRLDHQRGTGGFDALMRGGWAVFRGDDLMPPASVRTLKGATSRARIRFSGPKGWSFATAYPRASGESEWFAVERSGRRFDRPVGWMAAGRLGVRRDLIGGRRVAIAGPTGQGIRRLDMLAFLRWNMPELVRIFPDFPERLLIVSAGDPMWRGGLSGPASLYIHADRPLISGNGTSTLLHELMHVAQGYRAARDEDWIVEGIAEYYTLEIMRRSGTLSKARYESGLEKLEEWAGDSDGLRTGKSSGARTARGVMVMKGLDAELRKRSGGDYSLDDVARQLSAEGEPVSIERLRAVSAELVGGPLQSLTPERLDGD